jgi:CRISPR type III-A-associated protein Csm2
MSQNYDSKNLNTSQRVEKILGGDTDLLLQESEKLGRELAKNDLSNSQIRNIYSTVKRISSGRQFSGSEKHELKLLIPKIQYAVAREQRSPKAWKSLGDMLTLCIQQVDNQDNFNHFAEFFEAIVAFHYSEREKMKQERRHHRGGR